MRALSLVPFLLLLVPASRALAFSDPTRYEAPAEMGGGAGRFFTGSPLDGHACAVCHRGGATPRMSIAGLPPAFEVGRTYEVTVRWAEPTVPHALQLELVTENGESPPVELAAAEALPNTERCDSAAEGEPAVYVEPVGARRIVGVRDCGASELRFRFTAPAAQRIALSAAAVRSDSSGSPEGDGVSELRTVLHPVGARTADSGGCRAHAGDGTSSAATTLLLLAMLALRARRARPRRVSAFLTASLVLLGCYQPEDSARYEGSASDGVPLPWDGFGGVDGGARSDAAAGQDVAGGRSLFFHVQTAPFSGRYAPRNIGAIWVEDERGTYVKTLARWAGTRAMYLRKHQAISGGDLTDAVTSATLATHEVHEVRWNLTDRTRAPVRQGNYRVVVEMTDRDAFGPSLTIPFTYGDAPFASKPEGSEHFRELQLRLE